MDSNCFLCNPNPDLVFERSHHAFAMVGLGPITPTYCVLGAIEHVRSLADLNLKHPDAIDQLQKIRANLEVGRGSLLMTEHGRVPVCRDDGDKHDEHCFHGHALVFESKADITKHAASYYNDLRVFKDLGSALEHAATTEHYLLVSPSANQHTIFSQPLNAPRQLTRTLVAIAEGVSHLADWRITPNEAAAEQMAADLRQERTNR